MEIDIGMMRRCTMRSLEGFYRLLLAGLISCGLVIVATPPASADDFGFCTAATGCRADDANEDYCTPYGWPSPWGTIFTDAMKNLDSQTDMYRTYSSTCNGHTDIGGYLNTSPEYPSGIGSTTRGLLLCTKKVSGKVYTCDQASLVLNTSLLPDYTQRRKTLCHEIGHAVGLTHGSTYGGCMVSGTSSNITYATHHVNHINAAY